MFTLVSSLHLRVLCLKMSVSDCVRWSEKGDVLQCVDGTSVPSIGSIQAANWRDDMREWTSMMKWAISYYFIHSPDIDGKPMQNLKSMESYKVFHAGKAF